jgi:hypothetical protein
LGVCKFSLRAQKPNRIYSIQLTKKDSEWCVYEVKVTGDVQRDFFVETRAPQNFRNDVIKSSEGLCELNFDKLPENGGIISLDLDEGRKS